MVILHILTTVPSGYFCCNFPSCIISRTECCSCFRFGTANCFLFRGEWNSEVRVLVLTSKKSPTSHTGKRTYHWGRHLYSGLKNILLRLFPPRSKFIFMVLWGLSCWFCEKKSEGIKTAMRPPNSSAFLCRSNFHITNGMKIINSAAVRDCIVTRAWQPLVWGHAVA
jgi:hypothetical protein